MLASKNYKQTLKQREVYNNKTILFEVLKKNIIEKNVKKEKNTS
jgi:hypothetical protein